MADKKYIENLFEIIRKQIKKEMSDISIFKKTKWLKDRLAGSLVELSLLTNPPKNTSEENKGVVIKINNIIHLFLIRLNENNVEVRNPSFQLQNVDTFYEKVKDNQIVFVDVKYKQENDKTIFNLTNISTITATKNVKEMIIKRQFVNFVGANYDKAVNAIKK